MLMMLITLIMVRRFPHIFFLLALYPHCLFSNNVTSTSSPLSLYLAVILPLTLPTGMNSVHMTKPALTPWVESMYASMAGLSFETVTISGTKEFTAWEWKSSLVLKVDMEVLGAKKGDRVEMIGASLAWWDLNANGAEKKEDGKVRVIAEYSKIVGKG
jgi:hypothetical protein